MVQAWHFPPGSIEDKRAGDTQLHLPSILLHTLTENMYFTLSLTCFVLFLQNSFNIPFFLYFGACLSKFSKCLKTS